MKVSEQQNSLKELVSTSTPSAVSLANALSGVADSEAPREVKETSARSTVKDVYGQPNGKASGYVDSVINSEPLRVAVICDLREENWPSMDLVADSLMAEFDTNHADQIDATRVCPPMRRRLTRNGPHRGRLFNADRLANRFRDYPRMLRDMSNGFDVYHVVDHSYSQLVHELPPERTIVTCHDLDTFRCLLEPEKERRSPLFRAMAKRVLSGMQKAARVTCDSVATRDAILANSLLTPERLSVIPNGVHPAFTHKPNVAKDRELERLLGPSRRESVELLHVGSTIPRKRIDVLLRTFAEVHKAFPHTRLIRAGGGLDPQQTALAETLGIEKSIVLLPHLDTEALAAAYRRAAVVLLPSEREGFGLPVVEALACGTPVVASDLPVLHEVGGEAVSYCGVADVQAWTETVISLLGEREREPERWNERRDAGVLRASLFTWRDYVSKTVEVYAEVLRSCS